MSSTLWQPASGCGDRCRPGAGPRATGATAGLRVAGVFLVLLTGLLPAMLGGVLLRALARALLGVLGVRLVARGPAPRPGSLLVANHISWMDILALVAVTPTHLVAKHDVRAWPAVGELAGRIGTIFVDRTRPRALPATVGEVAAALRGGRSVAVFPEGTTYCGAERGAFRPAFFQAAIDAGAPVVPTSISYDTAEASFIGEDTLLHSIRRIARVRRTTITVITAPALRPMPGADRRALARAAQRSMAGHGYRLAA
ncbi:1-acyl-sn-glycerol-3-phosphate acyltransferase [Actinoplanes octamycinicus]|uniref:1-acyl-sn-glycerol-3-phosphate acyltransferase n=1 Tax=Actinoplanes octamycinicus TaxID=135948 RepID=A0A7W7GS26_9ACTN|nr:lysophospholipid acyltransferase family protein [Actinoplanes octamycinicus]MBB4737259.1 1-acyl-sn-glycerol-3-phosphate acyltransferase [Actinoplanes octamycinicus]GIE63730.1 1-acyl-sn-glycerol-3-phosphate acyltransferase [Actinoplanes octamycinicus]